MGKSSTSFKKGNAFWEWRSSTGRKPMYSTPEELWNDCVEYFDAYKDNPLMSVELVKFQGKATPADVPKMRAMSIASLCIFLGMTLKTWMSYREKPDFINVTSLVDATIREQKFQGACADLLNANIIARDLGLADKTQVENINPVKEAKTEYIDADTIT
jgi:hypothetical protein